jgi:hypothetical protein
VKNKIKEETSWKKKNQNIEASLYNKPHLIQRSEKYTCKDTIVNLKFQ